MTQFSLISLALIVCQGVEFVTWHHRTPSLLRSWWSLSCTKHSFYITPSFISVPEPCPETHFNITFPYGSYISQAIPSGFPASISFPPKLKMSRVSSVVYITGIRAGWSVVRVPAGARNFSLHHRVQTCSGAHPPPTQWAPGTPSLGVKRPGREADHSLPSSAEVK
jgi:hypothetical protein